MSMLTLRKTTSREQIINKVKNMGKTFRLDDKLQ